MQFFISVRPFGPANVKRRATPSEGVAEPLEKYSKTQTKK